LLPNFSHAALPEVHIHVNVTSPFFGFSKQKRRLIDCCRR
jgi:hypothetical protein